MIECITIKALIPLSWTHLTKSTNGSISTMNSQKKLIFIDYDHEFIKNLIFKPFNTTNLHLRYTQTAFSTQIKIQQLIGRSSRSESEIFSAHSHGRNLPRTSRITTIDKRRWTQSISRFRRYHLQHTHTCARARVWGGWVIDERPLDPLLRTGG